MSIFRFQSQSDPGCICLFLDFYDTGIYFCLFLDFNDTVMFLSIFRFQSQMDVDSGIETMEVDETEMKYDVKRRRVKTK